MDTYEQDFLTLEVAPVMIASILVLILVWTTGGIVARGTTFKMVSKELVLELELESFDILTFGWEELEHWITIIDFSLNEGNLEM